MPLKPSDILGDGNRYMLLEVNQQRFLDAETKQVFFFFMDISGKETEEDSLISLTGEKRNTIIAIGKGNRGSQCVCAHTEAVPLLKIGRFCFMFNDPGRKLKLLARILFVLLSIIPLLLGIVLIFGDFQDVPFLASGGAAAVLIGIVVILFGFLSAWLSSILLFAVGSAIDDIQTIRRIVYHIYKEK